jgi:hypothetical protein
MENLIDIQNWAKEPCREHLPVLFINVANISGADTEKISINHAFQQYMSPVPTTDIEQYSCIYDQGL